MDRKQLWFAHPRSFFELVIAGFSLVSLPLIVALVTGAFFVDKLTNQSQEAVYRAVKATQLSRALLEHIGAMERSIRQYFVLGDAQSIQIYLERHERYRQTSGELRPLLLTHTLIDRLSTIDGVELNLFSRLQGITTSNQKDKTNVQEFISLTEMAQSLLQDTNDLIDSEMAIMGDISEQARNIIFWEIMGVVPGAIIFTVVFIVLLSRPIRQIDNAIKKIGDGDLAEEIQVSGPRDLEYLGERLNWLRNRLKYLEEKKAKFLHYVSHELKTPLTAVREGAQLMSEGVAGPLTESQREVVDILRKNSVSLQKMIEKLLSFNMPGEANLSSGVAKLRMKDIVETVVADHKPVIIAKKLNVNLKVDEIAMVGDEEQLRVVVDNLLSNAVKHTPENGKIEVRLYRQAGKVVVDVKDSGMGIQADEKEAIFQAFYRGKSVKKGTIKGSGLGLSIVKEFVEAHNGTIELLSSDDTDGAHF
ncbi:MAG: ATP-binding protein, partial [Gammaproteobacteria bacterium]|nr:ATP-binding protein [Gammaproteobacteria bacterium]